MSTDRANPGHTGPLSYPDIVLLALPLLFTVVYGLGLLVGDGHSFSLGLAGLVGAILVGDALFVRPPTQ